MIISLIKHIRFIIIGLGLCLNVGIVQASVVAVVSADSPLTSLSKDQVINIFLGKTSSYPDGQRAVPIDQVEGSSIRNEFYRKLSGKTPAQIKTHWSKIIFTGRGQPPRAVADSAEVKKLLSNNPGVIGYIDKSQVDDTVKVLLLAQ